MARRPQSKRRALDPLSVLHTHQVTQDVSVQFLVVAGLDELGLEFLVERGHFVEQKQKGLTTIGLKDPTLTK